MTIARRVTSELHGIKDEPDFWQRAYDLADGWTSAGVGIDAVDPIFTFMEAFPTIDFGTPGALVHFIEKQAGYEDKLLISLARRPVVHTVWMLNRLINAATSKRRTELLSILAAVPNQQTADDEARASASQFLAYQCGSKAG